MFILRPPHLAVAVPWLASPAASDLALARCLSAGRTMTIAERIEHLEEDILDADCCTDGDCGCHRTAREARRELEQLRAGTRWCDGCGTDRPVEGMTFAKGEDTHTEYAYCSTCSTAAHDAAVEAAYREAYEGLSPLEQWHADGER